MALNNPYAVAQAPYRDILYGSRGDTIRTTDANGRVTSVTGGNPVPTEEELAAQYDFRATPGYEFRFGEGQRAVENSLIGRGMGLSGRAAKEAIRFGQDFGSAEYQNVFNRRAAIAGVAQPITQQLNAASMNMAGNVGNALMNAGNAQASSYLTGANAINNAVQGGIGNYLFYDAMSG